MPPVASIDACGLLAATPPAGRRPAGARGAARPSRGASGLLHRGPHP
jgi:hypothetical protein